VCWNTASAAFEIAAGRLEPGQSVSVWLSFNSPWRRRFNFLYSIRGVI